MFYFKSKCTLLVSIALLFIGKQAYSQTTTPGEVYFSWGYNTEFYSTTNIHVVQPSQNSDFTFHDVVGHDKIGWDKLFVRALSIPQYNYRLGYFFKDKDWGVELNFDHTKFVVTQGQTVHLTGKLHGENIDSSLFINGNVLKYQLNNGANFFLFNLVKRSKLNCLSLNNGKIKTDLLLKIGVGPVVPHVENTILGNSNKPHFQLGGWNTGFEAAIKVTFFKYAFLEFCDKIDYARYSHLKVYEGEVNQSFFTSEVILNLGVSIPLSK